MGGEGCGGSGAIRGQAFHHHRCLLVRDRLVSGAWADQSVLRERLSLGFAAHEVPELELVLES